MEAIAPDHSEGESPEIPRYEPTRPSRLDLGGGLLDVEEGEEVVRSHVNYIVADTDRWEQSATYYIDTHDKVVAFVKNQGLGFAIPYLHNGQAHDYVPDIIIKLIEGTRLILETKGYDPLEQVKVAAAHRWVDAVNADGSFGRWSYAIARNPMMCRP